MNNVTDSLTHKMKEYTKGQYKTEFYLPSYKGQKEAIAASLIHFQYIRIILEVFLRCIVVATTVFVITLTNISGKANAALFINIPDKTPAFTTVRTSSLASRAVFL